MTTRTLTFDLPAYHDSGLDADRAPLAVLRAAIVVGEHVVDRRCHYSAHHEVRETARLLRTRLQELLCFLDVYEQKLDAPPSKSDDDIPF